MKTTSNIIPTRHGAGEAARASLGDDQGRPTRPRFFAVKQGSPMQRGAHDRRKRGRQKEGVGNRPMVEGSNGGEISSGGDMQQLVSRCFRNQVGEGEGRRTDVHDDPVVPRFGGASQPGSSPRTSRLSGALACSTTQASKQRGAFFFTRALKHPLSLSRSLSIEKLRRAKTNGARGSPFSSLVIR